MAVRRTVSSVAYTRICRVALVLLCSIVVTGAAVRLTGSGLGCSDWPQCNSEKFIDVSTGHGAIEQVNRLFTGLVAAGVIAAVLAARRRIPYRADLVRLSWGLVVGVLAQVVLGGIVVLTRLHPLANMGHFVLSMVLVANGFVLVRRSARPDDGVIVRSVDDVQRKLIRAIGVLGSCAVITGTVVTGTGPHAGDEEAPRFGFDISHVARIHGISVMMTLMACMMLAILLRRRSLHKAPMAALEALIAVGFVQAAVGYVQYFNGVPAILVGVHILGATLFFLALVNLWTSTTQMEDNREIVERNSAMV